MGSRKDPRSAYHQLAHKEHHRRKPGCCHTPTTKLSTPSRARLKPASPLPSHTRPDPSSPTTTTTGHQLRVSTDPPRRSPRKRRPPPRTVPPPTAVTPSTSTTKRKRRPSGIEHQSPGSVLPAPAPAANRSAKTLAKQFCLSNGLPECYYPNPRSKQKCYPIFDSCKRAKR